MLGSELHFLWCVARTLNCRAIFILLMICNFVYSFLTLKATVMVICSSLFLFSCFSRPVSELRPWRLFKPLPRLSFLLLLPSPPLPIQGLAVKGVHWQGPGRTGQQVTNMKPSFTGHVCLCELWKSVTILLSASSLWTLGQPFSLLVLKDVVKRDYSCERTAPLGGGAEGALCNCVCPYVKLVWDKEGKFQKVKLILFVSFCQIDFEKSCIFLIHFIRTY